MNNSLLLCTSTLLCKQSPKLFSCKTETLYPLNNSSQFSTLSCFWQLPFYFLSLWSWLLQVPRINRTIQHLSFCDRLSSLRIMSSRFIHVVGSVTIPLLFKAVYFLSFFFLRLFIFYCTYTLHFIHPFFCWWALGCFHFLALVNNAAMNMGVRLTHQHIIFWCFLFLFLNSSHPNGYEAQPNDSELIMGR